MQSLWMVLGAFFFACMGVCVKLASADFNNAELVFWRGIVGVVFMGIFARSRGVTLGTRYPGMHVWRSMIGVTGLAGWFYAIAHLPLATAMTLNYMSSIWVAVFIISGALITWTPAKGHPFAQGPLMVTVLAGFAGVVLMLRPSVGEHQMFAALIGLLSGLGSAMAYMQVSALARAGEPEERTVFYFAIGTMVAGVLGMLLTGLSEWSWRGAIWLVPIGLLASGGQLCMTRAYSQGSTLVVANLQYSGIVFSALFGVLLFGDVIPLLGWIGMALIVGSGVLATVLRNRAAPGSPAEDH
ncbi:MAG: DMT family transporter [Burkholderiaceae bacterium]|nr:DMT family transporter [Burkholderiaceae bacterium]